MDSHCILKCRLLQQLSNRWSSAMQEVQKSLAEELMAIESAGTYKRERIIEGRQGVEIKLKSQKSLVLNFCANNYLGLSSHPQVIEAGRNVLETHGAGLSSVRFICGTMDIHRQLEGKIAKFHSRDDSILYAACFDANAGVFETLLSAEDAVLSDELNHASIIDGIRLCKAQKFRYKHMDMADLEDKLKQAQGCRRRLIATDGVFSMDGDISPLPKICDLADQYKSLVFVDDCHATGFFGKTGRGTEEYLNCSGRVDIINSTLGKALGGAMGGYTCGPKEIVDLLRQRSRPYLFSNSLAPAVVGSSSKVFDLLMTDNIFARSVHSKTMRFRDKMSSLGFKIAGAAHPICPVMLGDAKLAGEFANRMLTAGIFVVAFSFPVVPRSAARIRVQISAAHTDDHIDKAVQAFASVGKELGVI